MTAIAPVSNIISIDEKGRIVVPSDIRRAYGQIDIPIRFFVGHVPGTDYLSLHPEEFHEVFFRQLAAFEWEGDDDIAILRTFFEEVSTDKVGRIILSSAVRKEVGITNKAIIIHGAADRFQIWSPDVLVARKAKLAANPEFATRVNAAIKETMRRIAARPQSGGGIAPHAGS